MVGGKAVIVAGTGAMIVPGSGAVIVPGSGAMMVPGSGAMIVAGIGCRAGVPAAAIMAILRRAACLAPAPQALAAPDFKAQEPGLREAAARLGLALLLVDRATLRAAQQFCVTSSAAARRATGLDSVAEAAAIGANGTLLLPRLAGAGVTCAIARRPQGGAAP
jgi:cobalamin biosynthesis protein CbiG